MPAPKAEPKLERKPEPQPEAKREAPKPTAPETKPPEPPESKLAPEPLAERLESAAPATEEPPAIDDAEEAPARMADAVDYFKQALAEAASASYAIRPETNSSDPHEALSDVADEPYSSDSDSDLGDDDAFARAAEAFSGEADTGGWEDPDDGDSRPAPSSPRRPQQAAPRKKKSARDEGSHLTMEEALARVSPEAQEVLKTMLKGQFREVRRYP